MQKTKAKDNAPTIALIYCRVSSKAQELDGDGLGSQEHRCRPYAEARGYIVEQIFSDTKSAGGDFMKRPGMVALLQYLRQNAHTNYVVIFDDLKRFARDTEFHIRLRAKLAQYGAVRNASISGSRTRRKASSSKQSLRRRASWSASRTSARRCRR